MSADSSRDSPSSCAERVNSYECIDSYNGDIQDYLVDLVSLIETHDSTKPDNDQRGRLIQAVVGFVEFNAGARVSQDEMRESLKDIRADFDEFTTTRADEKGSPYQKLTNLYRTRRTQRERQHRTKSRESKGS